MVLLLLGLACCLQAARGVPNWNTIVGDGSNGVIDGFGVASGMNVAKVNSPNSMVLRESENQLFFTEQTGAVVRRINLNNYNVSTIAGSNGAGAQADGPLRDARFSSNLGQMDWEDAAKTVLLLCDENNFNIRRLDLVNNNVTTILGSRTGLSDFVDGVGIITRFTRPRSLVVDSTNGFMYIADSQVVRRSRIGDWNISTFVGKDQNEATTKDGFLRNVEFGGTIDTIELVGDYLYVAITSQLHGRIVRIDLSNGNTTSVISTENADQFYRDGTSLEARIAPVFDMAYDDTRNDLYLAETDSRSIRKLDLNNLNVSTVAGGQNCGPLYTTCTEGFSDGIARAALYSNVESLVYDSQRLHLYSGEDNSSSNVGNRIRVGYLPTNSLAPTSLSPATASPTSCSPTTFHPTSVSPSTANPTSCSPTTFHPTSMSPSTANPTSCSPTTNQPTSMSPSTGSPTSCSPTTFHPTSMRPSTSNPTSCSPTTLLPTSLSPKTSNPTSCSPSTFHPGTISPSSLSPSTSSPTTANPTSLSPSSSNPTSCSPSSLSPSSLSPSTCNPTTCSPSSLSPSSHSPSSQTPTSSSPSSLSPSTLSPSSFSPRTLSPASLSPQTGSPATVSPQTVSPLTTSPTSNSPLTVSPLTASPNSNSPLTASPLTVSPLTASPGSNSPLTASPATVSPLTTSPETDNPSTQSPLTVSPATLAPGSRSPSTGMPSTISPTTVSPSSESPVTVSPSKGPTSAPFTAAPNTNCPVTVSPSFSPTVSPVVVAFGVEVGVLREGGFPVGSREVNALAQELQTNVAGFLGVNSGELVVQLANPGPASNVSLLAYIYFRSPIASLSPKFLADQISALSPGQATANLTANLLPQANVSYISDPRENPTFVPTAGPTASPLSVAPTTSDAGGNTPSDNRDTLFAVALATSLGGGLVLVLGGLVAWRCIKSRIPKSKPALGGVPIYMRKEIIVGEKLGEGYFAVAYKAKIIEEQNKDYVLKKHNKKGVTPEIMDEIKKMAELEPHPNVLRLTGIVTFDDTICFLSNYYKRGSLDKLHDKLDLMEQKRLLQIVSDVSKGLSHLHTQKMLHRDLACRNLLMALNGRIVIADYGLAHTVEEEKVPEGKANLPWPWMPPETIALRRCTEKSDIWSLGVCMWEILHKGQAPYFEARSSHRSAQEVKDKIVHGAIKLVPVPPEVLASCPLGELVMRECMQEDPNDRPTANDLLIALEAKGYDMDAASQYNPDDFKRDNDYKIPGLSHKNASGARENESGARENESGAHQKDSSADSKDTKPSAADSHKGGEESPDAELEAGDPTRSPAGSYARSPDLGEKQGLIGRKRQGNGGLLAIGRSKEPSSALLQVSATNISTHLSSEVLLSDDPDNSDKNSKPEDAKATPATGLDRNREDQKATPDRKLDSKRSDQEATSSADDLEGLQVRPDAELLPNSDLDAKEEKEDREEDETAKLTSD